MLDYKHIRTGWSLVSVISNFQQENSTDRIEDVNLGKRRDATRSDVNGHEGAKQFQPVGRRLRKNLAAIPQCMKPQSRERGVGVYRKRAVKKERMTKINSASEFLMDERCWITELYNTEPDEKVSIARARVEPGVTTARHFLEGNEERYVILSGEGEMEVGSLPPTQVVPGDVVVIPAGVAQRIANTGKTDLIFLCVNTPPFKAECYRNLE
jgi:mannose-6-phosphate isomerase-like protein (cupin superfamily)